MLIEAEISQKEIWDFNIYVPLEIQVRFLLNKKGIKFEDDGKVSASINTNPIPLGKLTWRDCYITRSRFYTQELIGDNNVSNK